MWEAAFQVSKIKGGDIRESLLMRILGVRPLK
jgi:hypothetical protein